MLAEPSVIASRYRVIREIGRGAMGVVYEVEHAYTNKRHALKLLLAPSLANPEIVDRFKREMKVSSRIESDHVIAVTDADVATELGGAPFLVMEMLQGKDLFQLLTERGKLGRDEVVWLLGQAARGLDCAHAAGIVHRDLKPGNLFLHQRPDGGRIVKVLDFGIAKLTEEASFSLADGIETQTGQLLGTPLYFSFEQARGRQDEDPIGPPTDIWALGLIAFRLLTGKPYWHPTNVSGLLLQIMEEVKEPPSRRAPELSVAFDDWFLRSIHRHPAQRWATAGEQIAALAMALGVDAPATGEIRFPGSPANPAPAPPPPVIGPSPPITPPITTVSMLAGTQPLEKPGPPPSQGKPGGEQSTLSRSAAEMRPGPQPKRQSRSILAIAAVGGLVLAGAGGYWLLAGISGRARSPETREPTAAPPPSPVEAPPRPSAPAPPAAIAPREVELVIDSNPTGAEVVRVSDRASLGRTPLVTRVPYSPEKAVFRLKLAGYRDAQIDMPADRSDRRLVPLTRRPQRELVVDPLEGLRR